MVAINILSNCQKIKTLNTNSGGEKNIFTWLPLSVFEVV